MDDYSFMREIEDKLIRDMLNRNFLMEWISIKDKLPPLDKSYRCLAEAVISNQYGDWTGYVDVYFTASHGWRKCENDEMIEVKKWILIEDINL